MNYSRSVLSTPYPYDYFSMGNQALIEWKTEGPVSNDSFLQQLQKNGSNTPKLFSSLDNSGNFLKENSFLLPQLFLFHMSRCGSTYAANYFATNKDNRVYNEPYFLIQFIRKNATLNADNNFKLKQAIQLLGCGALPNQKRLILKSTSGFIRQFKHIHSLFPEVPKVFLYRDPKEVLISLLEGSPEYLPPKKDGEEKILHQAIVHLEDIFNHVIANIADFDRCINYPNLIEELKLLEYQLGWINDSAQRKNQLDLVQHKNSKKNNKLFVPDSEQKQKKWEAIQKKYKVSIKKLEQQFKIINARV